MMGKKAEKTISKEKQVIPPEQTDTFKDDGPYKCIGNFMSDFNALSKQHEIAYVPAVIVRPKRPFQAHPHASDTKLDKKLEKKSGTQTLEMEIEALDAKEVSLDMPPKTYTTRDKFQYFKPNIQVELETFEKWDTATEIYIRGWKIDAKMMEVFSTCFTSQSKLHTINFWNVGLTDETLQMLADFLPECANLKTLVLDGNSTVKENWGLLLGEKSLIQNLSLRHCGISDKGTSKLGKALESVKSLKLLSLNLTGNLISDHGAECLAECLRMNRTLLSLILSNNLIGDCGVTKLAEVLSEFALTHEEVVMRRKLLFEKSRAELKSPPSSRRGDSKDRPSSVGKSVQSQDKAKQKPPAKKKEFKGKESKDEIRTSRKEKDTVTVSVGKRESRARSGAHGSHSATTGRTLSASSTSDAGKLSVKSKKKDKGRSSGSELDSPLLQDHVNPLLEPAKLINGNLMIMGNRTLLNLNLSRNKIGVNGVAALLRAVETQATTNVGSKSKGTGLLRLVVTKNLVPPENETLVTLNQLMLSRDPFFKAQNSFGLLDS